MYRFSLRYRRAACWYSTVRCWVRMTRLGAPMPVVVRQWRWVSSRLLARYVRNESASAALAYLC